MINTLYIKSPTRPWVDLATYAQKHYSWHPKLWVGASGTENDFDCIGEAQFYSHEEAMLVQQPSFLKESDWLALDAEILKDLSWHQPIFHEMCNRWFINPERASYKIRAQYYNRMVEIWLNIFKNLNIELVVSPAIPHRVYDYVAYMVAKYLNVPYLMVDGTAAMWLVDGELDHCRYVIDDVFDRTKHVFSDFEKNIETIKISEDIKTYSELALGKYEQAKPKYLLDKERKVASRSFLERAKEHIPFSGKILYRVFKDTISGKLLEKNHKYEFQPYFTNFSGKLVSRALRIQCDLYHRRVYKKTQAAFEWLKNNSSEPSVDVPYVLFAASKQPERSTCPDAGHYYNAIDILCTLSDTLPEGWKIYYKEHPSNFRKPWVMDSMRSAEFYEEIKYRVKNIVFLPLHSDPFYYIDNAKATATATGSVAWEGIMRGIPGLIFGSTWYEKCSGIYKINNSNDAHEAFRKIISGVRPVKNDLLKYIECFNQIRSEYNISWRRSPNFGTHPEEDAELYNERIAILAAAYKGAFDKAVVCRA